MNCPQPSLAPHADAHARDEGAIDRALGLVLFSLVGGEVDAERLGLVVREVRARELDHVAAIAHRADQVVGQRVAPIGALGCRGQAQPERGPGRTWRRGHRWRWAGDAPRRRPPGRSDCPGVPCAGRRSRRSSPSGRARCARRRPPRRPRARRSRRAGRTTGAPDRAWARSPGWSGVADRWPSSPRASCLRRSGAPPHRGLPPWCAATPPTPRLGRGGALGARGFRARAPRRRAPRRRARARRRGARARCPSTRWQGRDGRASARPTRRRPATRSLRLLAARRALPRFRPDRRGGAVSESTCGHLISFGDRALRRDTYSALQLRWRSRSAPCRRSAPRTSRALRPSAANGPRPRGPRRAGAT